MDLVGPMDNSIEGYRFFAGFLDDHSSLGRTYALRHKSDQTKAFKEYKAWVENQTGQKMKWICTDRGGEYMSEEFIDYLKRSDSGILDSIRESRDFSDDTAESLEKAFDSFADQFETSEGGSIKAGHEEHEALEDEDVEQEQIVKQKRG